MKTEMGFVNTNKNEYMLVWLRLNEAKSQEMDLNYYETEYLPYSVSEEKIWFPNPELKLNENILIFVLSHPDSNVVVKRNLPKQTIVFRFGNKIMISGMKHNRYMTIFEFAEFLNDFDNVSPVSKY